MTAALPLRVMVAPLIYRRRPLMIKPLQPGFRPRGNMQTGLRPRKCGPFFLKLRRSRHHHPRPERPSNLITLRTFGAKPRHPSHHRCVQWCSRIGGGERSEANRRMFIMPYDIESQSRNADFIIRGEAATTTLGAEGPVKLKNPWAEGPSILRTFTSEPFEPSEPSAPSHRRCVQRRRATSPRT